MRITRRGVQIALGLLWLLAGALQFQAYMFTDGFGHDIIAPAGQGQPGFVAGVVAWAARLILAHPIFWNALFAAGQVLLGFGLLFRPTVRLAIVGSVLWALGVWYLGEGLGGLASGHADLLTGAPGAVLLYAVIAVAVWPRAGSGAHAGQDPPAGWLPIAWAVLWIGSAVLRALPGQNTVSDLAGEIRGGADGAPAWLAGLDRSLAGHVGAAGLWLIVVIVVVEASIGIFGIGKRGPVTFAGVAGVVVIAAYWVVGQSLGELYTGRATDPNTGPVVALLAVAMVASTGQRRIEPVFGRRQEPVGEIPAS